MRVKRRDFGGKTWYPSSFFSSFGENRELKMETLGSLSNDNADGHENGKKQ